MAKKLNDKQLRAVELLLAGQTPTAIAGEVDVSVESIKKWLSGDALFVATLNARRRDQFEADTERLRGLAGKAVEALDQLLEHYDPAIQLRAATLVLRSVSLVEVEKPDAKVTVEEVERAWREAEMWKGLSSFG